MYFEGGQADLLGSVLLRGLQDLFSGIDPGRVNFTGQMV
jgi:hypothetical protein